MGPDQCQESSVMSEQAVVRKQEVSRNRKEAWDRKAQVREFEKGDEVFMRKAGINTKLSESWEGPYKVVKRNSPLSYRVDTGDRIIPSVHIQLLKQFVPRKAEPRISRVTSAFDPDTQCDTLDDRYTEVQIRGEELDGKQAADAAKWEEDFGDTLTKEPGLTHLVQFSIDTGDHLPIFQHAYSTPTSLIESVDRELEWLSQSSTFDPPRARGHRPWSQSGSRMVPPGSVWTLRRSIKSQSRPHFTCLGSRKSSKV